MAVAATPRSVDKVLTCLSSAAPVLDEGRAGYWKISSMRRLLQEVDPGLTDAELDLALATSSSGDTINYTDFICNVFGQPPSALTAKPLASWTESETKTVLKIFQSFDKDNSCSLDVAELRTLCQALGVEDRVAEAESLINCGRLSSKDFFMFYVGCSENEAAALFARHGNLFDALTRRMFQQWSAGEIKAVLDVFKEFDKDRSGFIDSSELWNLCQTLHITSKIKDVSKLAKDGKLNAKEFFAWYVGCSPKMAGVVLARHGGLFESLVGRPLQEWSDQELKSVLQIFKDFDEDKSGSFNSTEFRSLCDMLWGAGNDTASIGVDKLMTSDGKIDMKDFFAFYVGCTPDEASAAFARV